VTFVSSGTQPKRQGDLREVRRLGKPGYAPPRWEVSSPTFRYQPERTSETPFIIKGREVRPKQTAKILGVTMDAELRYRDHMANAATKGLTAAMCLRRLKMLPPQTAR
jgi:hypothetical protein